MQEATLATQRNETSSDLTEKGNKETGHSENHHCNIQSMYNLFSPSSAQTQLCACWVERETEVSGKK